MPFVAPEGTDFVELIGAGTLFEVALVRERGALLACKRLVSRARREVEARAAIVREARFLALAKHPALPKLVRVGSDAHGPFVLEERIEGRALRELGEAWRSKGLVPPALLVRHIACAAVAAIAELHALVDDAGPIGAVHGDLGPDHFFFGPIGDVRLVDFGAARFREMDPSLAGSDRGTLPFVAPEVARGEVAPDAAADVYALAATLLYLATGEPLCHAREDAAALLEIGERGIRTELFDRADAFGLRARNALRAALAPVRENRIRSARELLAELDAA